MITPLLGRPRIGSERRVTHRTVSRQGFWDFLANGAAVKVTKSRDPGNTEDIALLRPGLLMGKITSGGLYAPSVIGLSSGALTSTGTTLSSSAAIATELVRRIGSTGTFKLTGPPTAAGTVRTLTATYSAASTTTGDITITALGVNEVQTVNLVTAATAGTIRLVVQKPDGTKVLTPTAAWSATDATLLSNLQTALDTATGVTNGIVATAIAATDTDLGVVLTFSGTGYANLAGPTSGGVWDLVSVHTLFTSNTGAYTVRTTSGVDGRFVSGSMIQPTDGSETILTLIPDGYGIPLDTTNALDQEWPNMPIGGVIDFAQTLPLVSDTSLKAYVKAALSTYSGGKFTFSDGY